MDTLDFVAILGSFRKVQPLNRYLPKFYSQRLHVSILRNLGKLEDVPKWTDNFQNGNAKKW